jgi:hypothetical protein
LPGGRQKYENNESVCRVQAVAADKSMKIKDLSAGFKLRWQTYTGNSWFCLPGSLTDGRQNTGNQ